MKRATEPAVRPILLEGRDALKERARGLGLRAIRYSNGHVRLRPMQGGRPTDFQTVELAEDYLDQRGRV